MSLALALCVVVAPQSVDEHAKRVAADLKEAKPALLKVCKSGDLSEIYFASYDLDGLLAAAEATGRDEFADAALECVDAIIGAGKDKDGDGYVDFYHSSDGVWDSTKEGVSSSTLFKGLRPLPRAARVIRHRFARKPYLARAQAVLDFVEKHVVEKWRKKGVVGSSRQAVLGCIFVDLHLATGKEEYRRLAEPIAKAWKDNMVLVDGGYVWNGELGNRELNQVLEGTVDGAHVQDTSHANTVLALATLACRAGIVFTEEDMRRFAVTFMKKLWKGPDKPLADFVDGAEWKGEGGAGRWGGTLSDGWVKLGLFSADMQRMLAQRMRIGSLTIEYWGNMALNEAMGRDRRRWALAPARSGGAK